MKTKLFSALAGLAVTLALLTPAFANHRTGSFALPELLSAGDFNGDGNLDLAVSSTGFDNVALYAGDGSGGLTLTGHLASDTLTKGLDVADINGDGRLDLVTATAWGYDVIVHLGDGAGGFGHRDQIYDGDGEPTRVILRDFNNDGKLDIAVNAPDEGKLLIYLNNLKGGFSVPAKEVAGIPHLFGLASGDFNKDGNLDLAVSSVQSPGALTGNALVLLGDGTGNFTQSANVTIKPLPTSVATGDLDNDGNVDFVVAGAQPGNTTGNFITTFLGDGTGKVTQKQLIDLGTGCLKGEISLGDFNEDGKLDLAFPVTGSQVRKKPSKTVLIYFGDGTGALTAGPIIDVGNEPHSVISRDFNKDGHLDLVVSNRTDGAISLLLGDGHGNFTLSVTRSVIASKLDP